MGRWIGDTIMELDFLRQILKRRRNLFVCLLFITVTCYYYKASYYDTPITAIPLWKEHQATLFSLKWKEDVKGLVDTPGCFLPNVDAYDKTVTKYLKHISPQRCQRPLVILRNQTLMVDRISMKKEWKFRGASCCARGIKRVTQEATNYNRDADYTVSINSECIPIPKEGLKVDEQYIKVECVNGLKVKVWDDFFPIVLPPSELSDETKRKTLYWKEFFAVHEPSSNSTKPRNPPPNVLILGIDSISRLHMMRTLPLTNDFLHSHGFVELKGYTKVGVNTFPNLMAALGGMTEAEQKNCWPTRDTKLDDCPFIWRNFSALNYITAQVEDAPGIAIFNYDKTGFLMQPADYYVRPLMVAEHQHHKRNRHGSAHDCLGGGLTPTRLLLKYISNFVHAVGTSSVPYFLLSWLTSAAHDDFNGLREYDRDMRGFLSSIVADPLENNTVIFFISDHGYRFGAFRETFMGFYEESLPFFFVRLPPSVTESHPEWFHNLKINSNRLTSPHDLYSTLTDLYDLAHSRIHPTQDSVTQFSKKSPSFFELGSLNRTCESSFIPDQFCICGVSQQISSSNDLTTSMARFIVDTINEDLRNKNLTKVSLADNKTIVADDSLCLPLTFSKFVYGREVGDGEKWNQMGKLEPYKDYLIALETSPWDARFEGRVRIWPEKESLEKRELLGSANRINTYRGKSDCISDYVMKNYCICKSLWEEEEKKRKEKVRKGASKKKKKS